MEVSARTNIRLTKGRVAALPHPENGQTIHRDSELRGFGLLVGKQEKSYFVER
ncbi:MAG: hypothetical protein ACI8TX_003469 [Hyphomicrobiaceae bacterium]|jgi:hypothetical protein